jgi:hypothetical protein
MYMLARKLERTDEMFKNIKVENGAVEAEDIRARSIAAAGRPGMAGSRRRLKAHMKNQAKFDPSSGRRRMIRKLAVATACRGPARARRNSGIGGGMARHAIYQ